MMRRIGVIVGFILFTLGMMLVVVLVCIHLYGYGYIVDMYSLLEVIGSVFLIFLPLQFVMSALVLAGMGVLDREH